MSYAKKVGVADLEVGESVFVPDLKTTTNEYMRLRMWCKRNGMKIKVSAKGDGSMVERVE